RQATLTELSRQSRHGVEVYGPLSLGAAPDADGLQRAEDAPVGLGQCLLADLVDLGPHLAGHDLELTCELLSQGVDAGVAGLHGTGLWRLHKRRIATNAALVYDDALAVPHPGVAVRAV